MNPIPCLPAIIRRVSIPVLWIAIGMVASAVEAARFIPLTPQNVRMADGSALPAHLDGIGWKWRPDQGNQGVFESNPEVLAKILMAQVDGLEPGTAYEVFGYFWADGYGLDHPEKRQQCPAQFGTSLATLHTFDGPDQPTTRGYVCAWEVTPGGTAGRTYGLDVAMDEDNPLPGFGPLKQRHGEAKLVRARLGRLRADAAGRLPVFFAEYSYNVPAGPTWIDAVAVRPVDAEGPLEEGWKEGTWLHLALRAGDTVTLERELAAGADVNLLDEEHLSPLFHAVTSADPALVKRFIELGADPNLANQSVPPLCAALVMSQEEVVRMLLDAGAEVPATVAKDHGTLSRPIHPGGLHPLVCALRSGSVPILKLILAKLEGVDLHQLMEMKLIEKPNQRLTAPKTKALEEAINAENWELACFLIDNGMTTLGGYEPNGQALATLVTCGEPAMPVFERLLKAGVPAIDITKPRVQRADDNGDGRRHDGYSGTMQPFDALTAAVWCGDVELAKRFIREARYANRAYIDLLYATAAHAQNEPMLDLLNQQFRRIRPLRWQSPPATEDEVTLRDEDLRVFLPRTTAPPARPDRKAGTYVLGVIASPGANDAGDSLAVVTSATKGWVAVDRDQIDSAMMEAGLDKPWLQGEHHLSSLGDRLKADALVVVDTIKGGKESLFSFEVVEVATGLVIHREHILGSSFKPQDDCIALLERASRALDAAALNAHRQAVTLLSFSASSKLSNELALAKVLQATIQRQIDSTPAWISLTRSQSARLVEEQALQGKNSIWGAAHLVEGSVSPAEKPDTIKVALRLETLGANRSSAKTDAEAIGSIDDPTAVITAAWTELFSKVEGRLDTQRSQPDPAQATEEAKRLLREAEWLMAANMAPEKIEALIDAAFSLGGPPNDIIRIHLDYLFRRIHSLSCRNVGRTDSIQNLHKGLFTLQHLPVALDLADRMAHELPLALELLHQAGYYFGEHGERMLMEKRRGNHQGNEFWLTINALSYLRAAIYPDHLPEDRIDDYKRLCRDLDAFTKRYYETLDGKHLPDIGRSMLLTGGHRWIFKRNPELYRGMVRTTARVNRINQTFPRGIDRHFGGTRLAHDVLKELEANTTLHGQRLRAELECYVGAAKDGPVLGRRYIDAAARFNASDWYHLGISLRRANDMAARHNPSSWFGWSTSSGGVLPTFIHTPRPAPEVTRMHQVYLNTNHYRSGLPQPIETRWYSIGSSEGSYDKKMQQAVNDKDAEALQQLLDALPLHHMYSGHDHRPLFEKRYGRALQELTNPDSRQLKLKATLLTDFAKATVPQAGIAHWFMRDEKHPDILWALYYSSTGGRLIISKPERSYSPTSHSDWPGSMFYPAWLLGIDCSTGEVITKVNLTKKTLEALGCSEQPDDRGAMEISANQNDVAIMMNVTVSHHRSSGVYHNHKRYGDYVAIIDKATGKLRVLPEEFWIQRFTQRKTHALWHHVAGIGDEFFFIDAKGYDAAGKNEKNSVAVWRVGPDAKPTPLIEHGRRPAITPFDSMSTVPDEIAVEGDRLLVFNAKDHAYFNAKDNTWEWVEKHHTAFGYLMYHFDQRERDRVIGSVHRMEQDGGDSGWKIDFTKAKHKVLWCINDELGAAVLHVDLQLPKAFRENTKMVVGELVPVDGSKTSMRTEYKESDVDTYLKRHPMHAVVVNQTEDSMILALQVAPHFRWRSPIREALFMPFLWKVSKKDMIDILESDPEP